MQENKEIELLIKPCTKMEKKQECTLCTENSSEKTVAADAKKSEAPEFTGHSFLKLHFF